MTPKRYTSQQNTNTKIKTLRGPHVILDYCPQKLYSKGDPCQLGIIKLLKEASQFSIQPSLSCNFFLYQRFTMFFKDFGISVNTSKSSIMYTESLTVNLTS